MSMDQPHRSAPPRADSVISDERFERYHAYARRRGVNKVIYFLARALLVPFFLAWFRLQRTGREHARVKGGLIVASNHRSFLDPFVIGALLPWRRQIQFVAKVELFEKRWQGWLLSRLGAFPIRRGQSDETAMETARLAVERGGTVVIFPEGTRIRTGSLGTPKRGVGRLALESGASVLPVAVYGSEQVRRGLRIRPRKVCLRAGTAMTFPRTEHPSPALAATVTERIWPNIELQWEWLGGLPPLRKAAVIGAGSWGTALAVLLARGGVDVQLGTRSADKAEELRRRRENERFLPGVKLPEEVSIKRTADIELGACDLVCLAVPAAGLPATVGALGDRIGSRCSVLLLSKGLVQPAGTLPNRYVAERIRARAIACLGGPAHAREAAAGMAALVLGSTDGDLRAQLGEVFDRAGLVCERSDDVVGVESAGAAKNAAALATAARVSCSARAFPPTRSPGGSARPPRRSTRCRCWPRPCRPQGWMPQTLKGLRRWSRARSTPVSGSPGYGVPSGQGALREDRAMRSRLPVDERIRHDHRGSGGEGRARPRLRAALPRPSARRLLLLVLPGRESPRRRGPHRAGISAGLPPLRARAPGVERPTAASVADPDRAQPRGELPPGPLPAAGGEHRGDRAALASARHRADRGRARAPARRDAQAGRPFRRAPGRADHAVRARHVQPRDRQGAWEDGRRDQGADSPSYQAARGTDRGGGPTGGGVER